MKRLCIYFFYDKDGVVDNYVPLYLRAMRETFSEICVVVNGNLTQESEEKLCTVCDKVLIRENIGFDSWAYKEALYAYGLNYIAKNFDEVLLNNFTCFGPIGSFKPMFDKMDKSICDFWGHCYYCPKLNQMVNGKQIPEHLMSYFVLFRKSILQSKSWEEYWETLAPVKNYDDARLNHEFRLTPFFEQRGFISDAFIDKKYTVAREGINGSVHDAYVQLNKFNSPLLKRKVFFSKNGTYTFVINKSRYNKILYKINSDKSYDLKLIFSNLIRTGDFVFSKNKLTIRKKIKWFLLGSFLGIRKYSQKIALHPDFNFIKKVVERK